MAREVCYEIARAEDVRERHHHRVERGKVVYYMVQLEAFSQGEWKPVIRFDCAHGYSHVDRYNLAGKIMKGRVDLGFAEALTAAEDAIEQNWKVYLERFLEGRYP